eukprot:scaffold264931_cov44-Prasinocladus_malaysianus.AAC.1
MRVLRPPRWFVTDRPGHRPPAHPSNWYWTSTGTSTRKNNANDVQGLDEAKPDCSPASMNGIRFPNRCL